MENNESVIGKLYTPDFVFRNLKIAALLLPTDKGQKRKLQDVGADEEGGYRRFGTFLRD